ncbi:MAG: hypothetical protein FWE06_07475 [Oscillospiraceae bacterium]|nr:hypothetical protein [Oscillospiraceae bacterium]
MMMDLYNTLKQLCDTHSPSGHELLAAHLVRDLLELYVDDVSVDATGSVRAFRGDGTKPTLLLQTHLDEVGLIVTSHEDEFLRVAALGNVDISTLPGQQMVVLTPEPMMGMVAVMPPHALSDEDRMRDITEDKLFVDVGLRGELLKQVVPAGTPIVFDAPFKQFGDGMATGKALSCRAGLLAVLYAIELLQGEVLPFDIAVVISPRRFGQGIAAQSLSPLWAIVVDAIATSDTLLLNGGVAVNMASHVGLFQRALAVAEAKNIPVMKTFAPHNGRQFVPTLTLSLPVQSMHSPVEVARLSAVALTARWIVELVKSPGDALHCAKKAVEPVMGLQYAGEVHYAH